MGGVFIYRIQNIGKVYKEGGRDKWVLKGLNLLLPSTGLYGIEGSSGSGKSTLLNILSLLEEPTEGKIYFDKEDLSLYQDKDKEMYRAECCAFLYQHFNLIEEWTALDNVTLPLLMQGKGEKEAREEAETLFKKYSLGHLMDQKVSILSGGEKSRVSFLRAIIKRPKVIFADEPTGALDEENAILMMESLKEISKDCLVIIVSHNHALLEKYSDSIFVLKNGRISKKDPIKQGKLTNFMPYPIKKKGWFKKVLFSNTKANIKRNVVCTLSSFVSFSFLLLCLGFFNGSRILKEEEKYDSPSYLSYSISLSSTHEIEGSPLSLSSNKRPPKETIKSLFGNKIDIRNDYSYFFPSYGAFSLNGFKNEGTYFVPLLDISLSNRSKDFLLEGSLPEMDDYSSILINEALAEKLDDPIGKSITIEREASVEHKGEVDVIPLSWRFFIKGIVKEFSFMSMPKVYYSYDAVSFLMEDTILENISLKEKRNISIAEYVDSVKDDSPYSSYGYCLFPIDEEASSLIMDNVKPLSEKMNLSIRNDFLTSIESYSSLSDAFSLSLVPFALIMGVGVAFILGAMATSSFLERKKQAAIILSLGADKTHFRALYLIEAVAFSLIGGVVALLFSPLSQYLSSLYFLKSFSLENMVRIPFLSFYGFPMFAFVAVIVLSIVFALIGAGIPLIHMMKGNLNKELRDE